MPMVKLSNRIGKACYYLDGKKMQQKLPWNRWKRVEPSEVVVNKALLPSRFLAFFSLLSSLC